MSAPERIWANAQEWPKGTGRIEVYASSKQDPDEPATEYIRADKVAEMIRQAVNDATSLHLVISAIREATVGVKPMLSDLPAALLEWRQAAVQAERDAALREAAAAAWNFEDGDRWTRASVQSAILNMIPKEAHDD